MMILNLLRSLFARRPGAALRERQAAIPADAVRDAGYIATFARSGSWPFNQQ